MAESWLAKLRDNLNLRRAAPWLAAGTVLALALVLLGPGFAVWQRTERATEPAAPSALPQPLPASAEVWRAEPPERLAAVSPGLDPGHESWSPPVGEAPGLPALEAGEDPAISLDCIIEPSELIDVRSPVRGRIEQLLVERGEPVEAGQVLVELESSVEQAAVEVARGRSRMTGEVDSHAARLELGVRKHERAKKLYKGDALSVDRREEAETEAKVARLELRRARENRQMAALDLKRALAVLERRTISSPVSGYVVDRLMSPGEVVDEEVILRLAQIDPLLVEVILPAALYGSILPGTRAAVTPEIPGDRVHVAPVTLVDPVVDAASGTFSVRLELPNPDHSIPGGLRCQVRFLAE